MLDYLFTFATGKVATISAVVAVASLAVLYFVNPKNEIKAALGRAYVATDSPAQTEGLHWYGYKISRVTDMLKLYDKEPERFYGLHERFIKRHDLIFPLFYAVPLVLIIAYLLRQAGGAPRWLALLPLAAMAFDYAENFTMLAFLRRFRAGLQTPLTLLEISRTFTVAKWCVLLLPFVVLFIAFAVSRLHAGQTTP